MKAKLITGALAFLMFVACATSYKVLDPYDESVNFSEWKTYAWKPIRGINWLDHSAFKRAVDEKLSSKGYNLSPADADFVIETAFNQKTLRRSTVGPRVRPQQGDLILIFVTPDTEKSIWHGKAKVQYDSRFPMQKQAINVEKAASEILVSFPPPPSVSGH